jgi:general secretion pathway protein J
MRVGDPAHPNGFTLVELLVALFVFSLISVAGVTLLRSSADGQIALKDRLGDHSAAMRGANLLEADLAQAVQRQVRDFAGNRQPSFTTDPNALNQTQGLVPGGQALFAFTRTGLSAGNELAASGVGRVAYSFAGGALQRISWRAADGAPAAPAVTLIDDLQSVSTRYRDNAGQWRSDWNSNDPAAIPRALELTLTPKSRPPYRLVMLVGAHIRPANGPGQASDQQEAQN